MWIGALVAIAAAGLAIPLLRTQDPPPPAPEPPPAAVPPLVYAIDFADDRHGFALWGRCVGESDHPCESRLLVTEDGMAWRSQAFATEELASPSSLVGRVVALGAGRVLLTDLEGGARFHSADAGRTWRAVPAVPDSEVAEIPPDGLLEAHCADAADAGSCRIAVTLPDSGHRAWLTTAPALGQPSPEQRPLADGSWWVNGRDRSTGQWSVAVSRDAGRTWSTAVLPFPPVPAYIRVSPPAIAGTGPSVYALATASLPDTLESRTLLAIFHSGDGGQTWTQTWRIKDQPPRTLGGAAVVTPDGALLVAPDDIVGSPYRSRDGGRTFTAATDAPRLAAVRRTRTGYLASAPDRPQGHYRMSTDGAGWTDVRLPDR
ncbi:MAG TPA: sialidase family protein [Actinophytocola sp.]|uniref:WD40/YVTN/BNR-like repeat-containing protein n=1 Tax=Actinophytocola sp. TaxID=1872138 RepID=UPI002DDC9B00|nr:sialidase family protein [Actinophytocola sp.]HEV2780033.1 sialidase family protein [Actinophytocola sp.]